jgi:hypothetical protein
VVLPPALPLLDEPLEGHPGHGGFEEEKREKETKSKKTTNSPPSEAAKETAIDEEGRRVQQNLAFASVERSAKRNIAAYVRFNSLSLPLPLLDPYRSQVSFE